MSEQENNVKDQERFDTALPWYVNGTLAPDDRAWMDSFIRSHPEAASEMRLQHMLQATLHEEAATIPADVGLDKLMRRVRQDTSHAAPTRGLLQQLNERLSGFFGGFQFNPAMTTAFAVIAIQAGVIGTLMLGSGMHDDALTPEYARTRSVDVPTVLEGPFLKINFNPDARESDMRFALVSAGATLVSGPSQLGDYFVKVPAEQIDIASDQLQSSGLVESIVVVQRLPNKG